MLTCSIRTDGQPCGLPATTALIVQWADKLAHAFPRCEIHRSQASWSAGHVPDSAVIAVLPVQLPVAAA